MADRLQNDSDDSIQTIPTIGFNVETLQYKNIKFQVWDLGGQTSIRPYWRCYYPNTDAIIFVVDSADTERLNIAKQELSAMLEVFLLSLMVAFDASYRKQELIPQFLLLSLLIGHRRKNYGTQFWWCLPTSKTSHER